MKNTQYLFPYFTYVNLKCIRVSGFRFNSNARYIYFYLRAEPKGDCGGRMRWSFSYSSSFSYFFYFFFCNRQQLAASSPFLHFSAFLQYREFTYFKTPPGWIVARVCRCVTERRKEWNANVNLPILQAKMLYCIYFSILHTVSTIS